MLSVWLSGVCREPGGGGETDYVSDDTYLRSTFLQTSLPTSSLSVILAGGL